MAFRLKIDLLFWHFDLLTSNLAGHSELVEETHTYCYDIFSVAKNV